MCKQAFIKIHTYSLKTARVLCQNHLPPADLSPAVRTPEQLHRSVSLPRNSGHFWGQVTRVCPGMWQMPQVRGFLAAGGLLRGAPPITFLPLLPPSPPPLNSPPKPPGGGMFSSAHWKKPHCCSLGLPQVWNIRPLFGPSFCTVRTTAVSLQLHIVCPGCSAASPSCSLPPPNVLLNPSEGLGAWGLVGAGGGPRLCDAAD